MNAKAYGQGFDSTVRVRGDKEFCRLIHGEVGLNDCHLEGWPKRVECEMELLSGCPVWKWRTVQFPSPRLCLEIDPFDVGGFSCDHFGSAGGARDDPKTPEFEGEPRECGKQRDPDGHPMAGFFTIAHGKGEVQACRPDGVGCSVWREVDH